MQHRSISLMTLSVGTAVVGENQVELGTGSYSVEFRDHEGQLQFRLRDVDFASPPIGSYGLKYS